MPDVILRHARASVVEALRDTRVVHVMGPRQAGKSTLVEDIAATEIRASVVTLDDRATRAAAQADPTGFIAGLDRPVVIDEVQRVPDLLLAVKQAVDKDKSPGQFLLTGSSNILTNRRIKDALTGRIELVTLWPLSQAEIHGVGATFVDNVFRNDPPRLAHAPIGRDAFAAIVAAGGYPEARLRSPRRRDLWFRDYVDTLLDRDLRDVSDALKLAHMPRLLRFLAAQASNLVNYKTVADRLQLHPSTVTSYAQILETLFLIRRLPAWRPGLGAREVSSPKLDLVDSGLLAHLVGADDDRIRHDDQVTGMILENFVAMEIVKLAPQGAEDARVYHYRRDRDEVDLILERRSGDVVGLEVKATASPTVGHWSRLAKLRDALGERFRCGVLLYTGATTLPLGDRLWAVPLSGLWAAVE